MPTYEYRCEQGHTFEVLQRMSDDPVKNCSTCEAPVQRVLNPVAVHFEGSGFYTTDYARKKASSDGSGSSDSTSKKSESKPKESSSSSGSGSSSGGSSSD